MLNFGMIAAGFASVMTLQGLFYIALGTFVGIIFGAVPGLSGSVAIALFIPVTYTLEPNISIALIMGLMMGGVSGGLISAFAEHPRHGGLLRHHLRRPPHGHGGGRRARPWARASSSPSSADC